jgi:hypothetical protein
MILAKVLMFNRYLKVDIFSSRSDPQQTAPTGVMSPAIGSKTTTTDPAFLSEFELVVEVKLCANAEKWSRRTRDRLPRTREYPT